MVRGVPLHCLIDALRTGFRYALLKSMTVWLPLTAFRGSGILPEDPGLPWFPIRHELHHLP